MKLVKKNKVVFLSVLIVSLFLFGFMVMKGVEPFGSYSFVSGDGFSYVYPLISVFQRKLQSGENMTYFWNACLGGGFLPSYFFVVSSPLNFLSYFVKPSNLRCFIGITIVVRIIIASGSFGFFVSRRKGVINNEIYMIPLSCAYALSGFVLGYYHESMWLDSYAIFPIIMYGYNRMINDKKIDVYVISLTLSSFCNFFMTYMIALFLIIWFVFDDYKSIKDFYEKSKRFILTSFLAVGMSAFSIIITFFALIKTHVGDSSKLIHEWYGNIFGILKYQFFLMIPIDVSYDNNSANIYCGTFMVMLLFVYFFATKIELLTKIKRISVLLIILISMNNSVLNYVWHGFHIQNGVPNRFSFVFIFVTLLLGADVFEKTNNIKRCTVAFVIALLLPIVSYCFVIFNAFFKPTIVILILMGITTIDFVLFSLYKIKKSNVFIILLSILMAGEVLTQSFFSFSYFVENSTYYDEAILAAELYQTSLDSNDKTDIYRSKVIDTAIIQNREMLMNLNGVASFNGFNDTNLRKFLSYIGYHVTDLNIEDKGGYKPVDDLLGIKEIYTYSDVYVKKMGYTKVYEDSILSVYNNSNSLSLGFGVTNVDNVITFEDYDYFGNVNKLVSYMSGNKIDEPILQEIYPDYNLSGVGYNVNVADEDYLYLQCNQDEMVKDSFIKISFDAEKTGNYNMSFMFEDFSILQIYVNDEIRRFEVIQSGGVLALGEILEGDHVDVIVKTSIHDSNIATPESPILELHMAVLDDGVYEGFISDLKNNQMIFRADDANDLSGSATITDDRLLFTSIPYDEGWHIYENGKELEKDKYLETFICLDLEEGYHELEFKYIPKGFYIGIVITGLSWCVFIILMIYKRRKKDKMIGEKIDE